jgi:hypothetical protein
MMIYPLSLAIYCTPWTFFGSSSAAASSNVPASDIDASGEQARERLAQRTTEERVIVGDHEATGRVHEALTPKSILPAAQGQAPR